MQSFQLCFALLQGFMCHVCKKDQIMVMRGHAEGVAWGAYSEEEVRRRRVALEKKEQEAEQKHAELLSTQHANEKARLEAQVEREMATMRLAHIKAEQEFAARRAYYQVFLKMLEHACLGARPALRCNCKVCTARREVSEALLLSATFSLCSALVIFIRLEAHWQYLRLSYSLAWKHTYCQCASRVKNMTSTPTTSVLPGQQTGGAEDY